PSAPITVPASWSSPGPPSGVDSNTWAEALEQHVSRAAAIRQGKKRVAMDNSPQESRGERRGTLFPAPKGRPQTSPRQRPGKRAHVVGCSPERAEQRARYALSGLGFFLGPTFPGRCPGLVCGRPFGATEPHHQTNHDRQRQPHVKQLAADCPAAARIGPVE